jgi:hypothetical protein
MELMTVNLPILCKMIPAAYSFKLQGTPTVTRFAVSWFDGLCSLAAIHWSERKLKSQDWYTCKRYSLREMTSGNAPSTHHGDYQSNTCTGWSDDVCLEEIFEMTWWSKLRFCYIWVDQMYKPWHTRLNLPPCGPHFATSNISPNTEVNTRYHVQCSEKELFTASSRQIQQFDKAIHMLTSSRDWR